jgi:hypothetical protein
MRTYNPTNQAAVFFFKKKIDSKEKLKTLS